MTTHSLRDGSRTADQASRHLVGLATRAPSVHNTQPWLWRIDGAVIELYADMARRLVVEDPLGRNLVISCGAALHHLQVAANAFGWTTAVHRVPDDDNPSLLARVRVTDATAPSDLPELSALLDRRTDRRRFTSWPVPPQRVEHLAEVASDWGVHAVALVDELSRVRTRLLVETATRPSGRQHRGGRGTGQVDRPQPCRRRSLAPGPGHRRSGCAHPVRAGAAARGRW